MLCEGLAGLGGAEGFGLAFEGVAEDVNGEALGAGELRGSLEGLRGGGDDSVLGGGEAWVARGNDSAAGVEDLGDRGRWVMP